MNGEAKPTLSEYFSGRSLFITGGSGFLGKVLIEKLLRCCPDVECLYLLMRSKKGVTPQERWDIITAEPLFERLISEQPKALSHVVIVEGDASERLLGLSEKDQSILSARISVVIHSAASVRFDEPLEKALHLNTRGTREIAQIALKMKKLECLVYISTTYCNTALNLPVVEEKIYPATHDWKTMIELSETTPRHILSVLGEKILEKHPNTYTLTKSLAEQIMYEYRKQLPIVIFRPSVVISSLFEPIPGWIDYFSGMIGSMAAINKGLLRVIECHKDVYMDYVAVDFVVNGLLVAAWHRATSVQDVELPVYNCAYSNIKTATNHELLTYSRKAAVAVPFLNTLWHPVCFFTTSKTIYTILYFLLHLLPGLLIDQALKLSGRKPILMGLYRKIWIANKAFHTFLNNIFTFDNTHYRFLWTQMHSSDEEIFYLNPKELDLETIATTYLIGVKKYLFKESEKDDEKARLNYRRMYWLHRLFQVATLGLLMGYMIKKVIQIIN